VIGKVLRGERPHGLIYYLYGPGRHAKHTDPHIVAGWRHPAELEPPLRPCGGRDFRRLNGLLQQTISALGTRAPGRPVWHCTIRSAPGDRMLSDDEWARVAREVMHRTGLAPDGQEDDAIRWIAIRHADDHIHIVATLARQDGGRPRLSNDYYRVREACLAVESRFGLRRTAPGDRTAAARPTRAETEKTRRRGWHEAPRITLTREVSTAAAMASSEVEFFARLHKAGVQVRMRLSTRNPDEVTGYAVALPRDTTSGGEPVWYGGGKLAADLTLPKLHQRWAGAAPGIRPAADGRFSPGERAAIWEHAARATADAAEQIRHLTATGQPAAAADAAWAAGDVLHAAASALRSRVVRQAAGACDRAARTGYGRIPRPTPSGAGLRQAARLLSAAALVSHDRTIAQAALIVRLAALAEAIAELRQAQQHAAQAAAARQAAEQLRAATAGTSGRDARGPATSRVMTGPATATFPASQAQHQPDPRARRRPATRPAGPGPRRGPSPPRPPRPAR